MFSLSIFCSILGNPGVTHSVTLHSSRKEWNGMLHPWVNENDFVADSTVLEIDIFHNMYSPH